MVRGAEENSYVMDNRVAVNPLHQPPDRNPDAASLSDF